jgi:Rieske Fe-S protein
MERDTDLDTAAGSSTTRRTVLLGAGAVGIATALAACGPDPSGGSSGGGSNVLGRTSEIPVGGGKIFTAIAVVVTQPVAGDFKAFSATCTHQGCLLDSVDGGTINCPCHASKFSIRDGTVVQGPAERPLPVKKITVADGSISLG